MCRVKDGKEWAERSNHARKGAGDYVAERFSSSWLFHVIPRKAHHAQLKGMTETKEVYLKILILASGWDAKKEIGLFSCELKYF